MGIFINDDTYPYKPYWTRIVFAIAISASLIFALVRAIINKNDRTNHERLDDKTLVVYAIKGYDSTISLYKFKSKYGYFISGDDNIYTYHNRYQMYDTFSLERTPYKLDDITVRDDGYHDTLLTIYEIEQWDNRLVKYYVRSLQHKFISSNESQYFVDLPRLYTVGDILALRKKQ